MKHYTDHFYVSRLPKQSAFSRPFRTTLIRIFKKGCDTLFQQKSVSDKAGRRYAEELTECIGTFILVFAGSGAAIVAQMTEGTISHLGASFTSGAILAALIYTFGHISGAHVNPAVTLSFWSSGLFPKKRVLPYIVAQTVGGVLASMLLLFAFGSDTTLGITLPHDNRWLRAFVLETVLTFIMMMVVLGAGQDKRAHAGFGGLAIGLTVALEVLIMGPVSGGSMNPARSFAPALVSGVWQHQWLYWVAPILGGQLAVVVYQYISNNSLEVPVANALERHDAVAQFKTGELEAATRIS